MMRNYYYLVAGLPELLMDQERKDFSVNALKEEVKDNIHPSDFKLVKFLHLPYDNENFLNQLLKRGLEYSDMGNIEKSIFDELDENVSILPPYMQDFYYQITGKQKSEDAEVDEPEAEKDDSFLVEKLPEVLFQEKFFDLAVKSNNQFLAQWFMFIRDFSNVLSAINCRRLGIDPAKHLVGSYPLVEVLEKSQSADFGLKQEVDYIDRVIQISEITDIIERERKFDLLKWDMATELTTWDYFNINFILAFFIKAGIIQRWLKLDAKTGEELFKRLFDDLKASYNLSNSLHS
ncbi:MAG: DUF2764 family protein [Bacteroidales bacterium]